ncbi:transcriptional regulator [Tunturiibacter psychrotolerans]|uniref:transcriptional regulator n=1 Tax=Tunturiibacter psychrotolerans TaxID=3069686 RepID=UPI003D2258BD
MVGTLAILTVLSTCEEADFLFLKRATKLTRGNLSVQLVLFSSQVEVASTPSTGTRCLDGRARLGLHAGAVNRGCGISR